MRPFWEDLDPIINILRIVQIIKENLMQDKEIFETNKERKKEKKLWR